MSHRLPGAVHVVVLSGNEEPFLRLGINYHSVPYYSCLPRALSRIYSFIYLTLFFLGTAKSLVVSDFMPIPLFAFAKHSHYQLIHDIRSKTCYGRWRVSSRLIFLFQKYQWRLCRNLIAVSSFTKSSICEAINVPPDKIIVSYNGLSDAFTERPLNSQQRVNSFLYVATFEERKNHSTLLHALKVLHQQPGFSSHNLVLVGRDLGGLALVQSDIRALNLARHVEVISNSIPEDQLLSLYDSSKVFVSSSLFEGFGMPLIESLSRGCIVTCSDLDVFREILGPHASYFDPSSADSIAKALAACLAVRTVPGDQIYFVHSRYRWDSIVDLFCRSLK
jgi:glycosyltransferase involved in cell wall biosynthesis